LYELDATVEAAFKRVHDELERIAASAYLEQVDSSKYVNHPDRKYVSGASTLIKSAPIRIALEAPERITSNVPVPVVPAGNERLCFFPDRLIVLQGKGRAESIGVVPYHDLSLELERVQMILNSSTYPPGTTPAGLTWKYVNKGGGPDRRFKDNPTRAIIACERVVFRSATGLFEGVQFSPPGAGAELAAAIKGLGLELAAHPATAPAT
jgi:hypothetical protein